MIDEDDQGVEEGANGHTMDELRVVCHPEQRVHVWLHVRARVQELHACAACGGKLLHYNDFEFSCA